MTDSPCLIMFFNYQLRIGQVYWPRRFKAWQNNCYAIQRVHARIAKEVFVALYAQQSTYMDANGKFLGEGLFNTITFKHGDIIAQFHGRHIDEEECTLEIEWVN